MVIGVATRLCLDDVSCEAGEGGGGMKLTQFRRVAMVLGVCALFLSAGPAEAQMCTLDQPAKAKVFKSDLVRAYASCPGIENDVPDAETSTSVPACSDVEAPFGLEVSSYHFGPGGKCSVKITRRTDSWLGIQAKCTGIVEPDGTTLASGDGWQLWLSVRATIDEGDPVHGDMTLRDFYGDSFYLADPIRFDFDRAEKGTIKLKQDIAGGHLHCRGVCSPSLAHPCYDPGDCAPTDTCEPEWSGCPIGTETSVTGLLPLGDCVNLEILHLAVVAPGWELPFARIGFSGN
jgi:hypothetical protein